MFNVAGRLSACGHCEGVCFFYEDDEDEYQVIKVISYILYSYKRYPEIKVKGVEIAKEVKGSDGL